LTIGSRTVSQNNGLHPLATSLGPAVRRPSKRHIKTKDKRKSKEEATEGGTSTKSSKSAHKSDDESNDDGKVAGGTADKVEIIPDKTLQFPTASPDTLSLSQDVWLNKGSSAELPPRSARRKDKSEESSSSSDDSDSSEEEKAAKRPPKLLIPARSLKGGLFNDVRDKMKASVELEMKKVEPKQSKASESDEEDSSQEGCSSDDDSSEEEKAAKRPPKLLIPARSLKGGTFIDMCDKMKASAKPEMKKQSEDKAKKEEEEEATDEASSSSSSDDDSSEEEKKVKKPAALLLPFSILKGSGGTASDKAKSTELQAKEREKEESEEDEEEEEPSGSGDSESDTDSEEEAKGKKVPSLFIPLGLKKGGLQLIKSPSTLVEDAGVVGASSGEGESGESGESGDASGEEEDEGDEVSSSSLDDDSDDDKPKRPGLALSLPMSICKGGLPPPKQASHRGEATDSSDEDSSSSSSSDSDDSDRPKKRPLGLSLPSSVLKSGVPITNHELGIASSSSDNTKEGGGGDHPAAASPTETEASDATAPEPETREESPQRSGNNDDYGDKETAANSSAMTTKQDEIVSLDTGLYMMAPPSPSVAAATAATAVASFNRDSLAINTAAIPPISAAASATATAAVASLGSARGSASPHSDKMKTALSMRFLTGAANRLGFDPMRNKPGSCIAIGATGNSRRPVSMSLQKLPQYFFDQKDDKYVPSARLTISEPDTDTDTDTDAGAVCVCVCACVCVCVAQCGERVEREQ
jgi:hypothetical protein